MTALRAKMYFASAAKDAIANLPATTRGEVVAHLERLARELAADEVILEPAAPQGPGSSPYSIIPLTSGHLVVLRPLSETEANPPAFLIADLIETADALKRPRASG